MNRGLTISQAAEFAGVTVKTVRHYHRLGLLNEPMRDGAGYRRYRSADLLRLVQVRTLAIAGVPLAEIGGLLDADPASFTAARRQLAQRMTERMAELARQRATLLKLASGDRLLLPERACAVLDRLVELGFDPEAVNGQREAMVLSWALLPEVFDRYLIKLEYQLADPEYLQLARRSWAAQGWESDDPRLDDLASAVSAKLLDNPGLFDVPAEFGTTPDFDARYELINHHREQPETALARLKTLVEANLRAAGVGVSEHRRSVSTAEDSGTHGSS